ncbi:MAG: 3-methyladenine DNA glycosylase [Mycobacterium sp.]
MSEVLGEAVWTRRRDEHRDRVAGLIGPYLDRRRHGSSHPVVDFLFTYYRLRPAQLARWHPGFGVGLAGLEAVVYSRLSGYRRTNGIVTVDPDLLSRRCATVEFVVGLLDSTARRPAHFGCFGLHEWAMVYRTEDLRHDVPLRLGRAGTDTVVESMPLRCTHFDAFRFFTSPARARNSAQLSRDMQRATEQPGCLHAAMDLYKWCFKLLPLLDSAIVLDAFELAYVARELDMRASPYDLTALGYRPICIETRSGRAEYVREQDAIAARAATLRQELLLRCRTLLDAARG